MTAPRRERAGDAHMALQAVAWYTLDFTCLGLLEWVAVSQEGAILLHLLLARWPSGLAELWDHLG